ncbi:MAG: S-adenosylhomocysteine deaminase [Deltaproteobacteria bacterium HGW-Deltaproteobacteria-15]|jgi:5-methylthioadenosine/S-adenosylhomocysteine deaminase|nr:MAG: S-adenosylhomocysteine deaminase [Deltaproteobacteria bacterium HGW-Deltaproteobacteria-15]
MEQFDYLITNGTIVTMQSREQVLKGASLGITGDRISFLGDSKNLPTPDAKKVVDAKGGLVLPGLVNGHTHAAMTLFRGLADDLPLMEWLTKYIFPVEKRMDTAFVKTGALLACAEMILSGITTFCDMYLFEEEIAKAAKEAGMRCLVGEVLYDFSSPNYGALEKGFEYTERMIRRWKDDPLVSVAVEPHAVFTCSPELLLKAQQLAQAYQVPMIIHVAETLSEVGQVSEKYGKRPFEHLDSLGLLGPQMIAIHCIHLSPGEIRLVAEKGVKVVTAPESNMKLASGICPVPRLLSEGVVVGLGTDGCASNNNLDLFGEMDSLAKIHKVASMDPTVMDAYTVLRMATVEGARALGMEAVTGSLAPGKKADVIVVDTCKPHLTPMFDPYSQLVYAAKANDVSHSFINGRLVLEERKLLTLDVEEIMKRAREKARDVAGWVLAGC